MTGTGTAHPSEAPVCGAKLHLILPGENEPSVFEECDKTPAHQSYHGTLGGYNWHTYDPRAEAAMREEVAQDIEAEALGSPPFAWVGDSGWTAGLKDGYKRSAGIARGVR